MIKTSNYDIKILLVESNTDIKTDLEKFVIDNGFHFQSTVSVSEALEKLTETGFDIVISDLHLCDGSGFNIIEKITSCGMMTNTIFLTSNPSAEAVINAMKLGAYDFITKPVEVETILFSINRAVENIILKRDNARNFNELIKLNRLKNEFLTVVSHDLRSPLSSIAGYVNYLIKKGDLSDMHKRYLNVIRDITNDLYSLVNELLDISKIETGIISINKKPTDIVDLINTSINSFILLGVDKNTRIDFYNSIEDPIISIDRMKVLQVMNNIMSNSIKFTENGRVSITARKSGGNVTISISDTGFGMTSEQVNKIFDQYSYMPTKGTRGETGNGLGMVICKKFIDLHQGTIEISSSPGKGSTFIIKLPE